MHPAFHPNAAAALGTPASRRCAANPRRESVYLPPKNDGMGRLRIVCRPGVAPITFGIELTAIEAVAMSPWKPPATFIDRRGDPSISTES